MRYGITFVSYSGRETPLGSGLSHLDATARVRRLNREARRQGRTVVKCGPGTWEYRDETVMGDDDNLGWLRVTRQEVPAAV